MRAGLIHPPGERFNFAQHLIDRNAGRASSIAYIDDHETMTYGDLEERVRRLSSALRALGVHREERVLLLMHDNNDWPVSFLGCLHAGVVPVCINTLLTVDEYAYVLEHSRAQGALVSQALMPTLQKAMAQARHEIHFMLVSRPEGERAPGASGLRETIRTFAPDTPHAPTAAEEIAFWLYSSGSTGRPKGTVHTHANPYWTAELYGIGVLGITERDLCYSAAKLFFAYGLGNALTFPLSAGASVLPPHGRAPDARCGLQALEGEAAHDLLRRADGLRGDARLAQSSETR